MKKNFLIIPDWQNSCASAKEEFALSHRMDLEPQSALAAWKAHTATAHGGAQGNKGSSSAAPRTHSPTQHSQNKPGRLVSPLASGSSYV